MRKRERERERNEYDEDGHDGDGVGVYLGIDEIAGDPRAAGGAEVSDDGVHLRFER